MKKKRRGSKKQFSGYFIIGFLFALAAASLYLFFASLELPQGPDRLLAVS